MKVVGAVPMTLGEYMKYREFEHPMATGVTMQDKGYKVAYEDGSELWEYKKHFEALTK